MATLPSKALLVIGAQRSGTTFLANVLGAHPSVYLAVNGKLLYYLITWIYRDTFAFPGEHLRLDEIAYSLTRMPIEGIDPHSIQIMLHILKTRFDPDRFLSCTSTEVIRTIWYEVYAAISNERQVIGEKYNEYLLQLPEIINLLPGCHYIFVHRHPLDVAESMVRYFKDRPWVPSTYTSALVKWAHWNQAWLDTRTKIHPSRRMEVSYELLVHEPARVLRSICEFLGVGCVNDYLMTIQDRVSTDFVGRGASLHIDWASLYDRVPNFDAICGALGYSIVPLQQHQYVGTQ